MQTAYSSEKLVTLLESTLNPNLRKHAEDELGVVRFDYKTLFKLNQLIKYYYNL